MAKKTKSNNYFFEFLDQISRKKDPTFFNEKTKKDWNSYMILRFLSMDRSLLPIVNHIQEASTVLDPKRFYLLLLEIIPRKKRFFRYVKGINNKEAESVKYISKYFKCSNKEANEYYNLMGSKWVEDIKKRYGEIGFKPKRKKY